MALRTGVGERARGGARKNKAAARACVDKDRAAMAVVAMALGHEQDGDHGDRSEGAEGVEGAAHLGEADGERKTLGDDGIDRNCSGKRKKTGGWRAPHGRT